MTGKLKEIQKKSARKRWLVAAAISILLITSFFIYKEFSSAAGFKGEKSIAVLPFENATKDSSQEYISDGITQDIINTISKISSIKKVIGWFSVRGFKRTTRTLNDIAKDLNVAAILSGSMQKDGNKTHIVAELIEVKRPG
jgi:TolB-like protein